MLDAAEFGDPYFYAGPLRDVPPGIEIVEIPPKNVKHPGNGNGQGGEGITVKPADTKSSGDDED